MENQYNIGHAREILDAWVRDGDLLLDERGVWPGIDRNPLSQLETDELRWRPARQLKDLPGAPEVKGTPMLPNPFNARELAAFMLAGAGSLVTDLYGDWCDGPDPDSLDNIDPDSRARQAVIDAYAAYRLAIEKVGKGDADALARLDAAHKAYENSSRDKVLLKAFEDAQAEWDAAHQTWLTAMVVCLLEKPQAAPVVPAPATDAGELAGPGRRLIALRELGGTAKWKRGRDGVMAWQFTGITKLVQQEKAQGRKRCDEKTIRNDLREAAEDESVAKRNA